MSHVIKYLFYNLGFYFLGSILCSAYNHEPWDSESPDGGPRHNIFHGTADSALITTQKPPNWSMVPISSNSIAVSNEEPVQIINGTESIQPTKNEEPLISKRKRTSYNIHDRYTRFVNLGLRFKGPWHIEESFINLTPGISNVDNMTEKEMIIKFSSLGDKHRWKELLDYPLKEYLGYWGLVCDYFWKKENPDDERYRGCSVSMYLMPDTRAQIYLTSFTTMKAELLRCKCYYHIGNKTKPDSTPDHFAIHKYTKNEYFFLTKKPRRKLDFAISDFLTEVFLPEPVN